MIKTVVLFTSNKEDDLLLNFPQRQTTILPFIIYKNSCWTYTWISADRNIIIFIQRQNCYSGRALSLAIVSIWRVCSSSWLSIYYKFERNIAENRSNPSYYIKTSGWNTVRSSGSGIAAVCVCNNFIEEQDLIPSEIVGIIGKASMECNRTRCCSLVYVRCKKYIVDEDMFIHCFLALLLD